MKSCRWQLAIVLLLACFALGANYAQRRLESMDLRLKSMEVYMYVPSADFLKSFTFGFDQLIADYFWIKTIGYFGDQFKTTRKYPWLYHILDLVTTLDPNFRWPYYFGGIILSLEAKQVDQSNLLLKKAMRHYPQDWKFPFYLGFNYWYHLKDPATAASYIEKAARLPKAPRYLHTFPATLYCQAGKTQTALTFLREMEQAVQDTKMKEHISKKIRNLERQ